MIVVAGKYQAYVRVECFQKVGCVDKMVKDELLVFRVGWNVGSTHCNSWHLSWESLRTDPYPHTLKFGDQWSPNDRYTALLAHSQDKVGN